MPQLHLYLSRDLADEVKRRAAKEGLSVSRFLAKVVEQEVADEWPAGFFAETFGSWKGEPLERLPQRPPPDRVKFE